MGLASAGFHFADRELKLLMWIGMWGEGVAWMIRGLLVVGGAALWMISWNTEKEGES